MMIFPRCLFAGSLIFYCLFCNALHFRSVQSGSWSELSSWECSQSVSFLNTSAATVFPDCAADTIIVQHGHTIVLDGNWCLDQVSVEAGAVLTSLPVGNVFWNVRNGPGIDLLVNGILEDHCPLSSSWASQSTWQLGESATLVRSRGTAASDWKEHYYGGIATIPVASNWVLRRTGTDQPAMTTAGMYYGNLRFENHTPLRWDATAAASRFSGWTTQAPVVKGSLFVGDSTHAAIVVYVETPSELSILGDVHVGPESELDHSNHSGALGLRIMGHLYLSGKIVCDLNEANELNRCVHLAGTQQQYVYAYTGQQVANLKTDGSNAVHIYGAVEILNTCTVLNPVVDISQGMLTIVRANPSALVVGNGSFVYDEDPLHAFHLRWNVATPGQYKVYFGNSDGHSSLCSFDKTDVSSSTLEFHSFGTGPDNSNNCLLPEDDSENLFSDRYWKIFSLQPLAGVLKIEAAENETPFATDYSILRISTTPWMVVGESDLLVSGWYGIVRNEALMYEENSYSSLERTAQDEVLRIEDLMGRVVNREALEPWKVYLKVFRSGSVRKIVCIE